MSKMAFVRSLPSDLSAKDAVAKAKEAGLKVSEAYVYKIRSLAKIRGAKAKGASRGRATKAVSTMSKADFVRSLPPGISGEEAAEKAKAAGIELSKAYFYVLKSELKKKGGAPKGKPGRKPRAAANGQGLRLTSDNPEEQAVLNAVRAIGVERARALIATVEKFERG